MDLWRGFLDSQAGGTLDGLDAVLDDQQAFARFARRVIADLGYGDQLGEDPDAGDEADEDEDDDATEEPQEPGGDAEDESEQDEQSSEDAPSDQRTDPQDMQAALDAADDADIAEELDVDEGEAPERRPPPPHSEADPGYKVFVTRFDEEIAAEDLADPIELERLRAYLDQQLEPLKGAVARLANRLQRRLQAQQNRAWDFDLEEGTLDAGRLARVVANPMTPLSLQDGARHRLPRHRGDAAPRQLRLDARPADLDRRDLAPTCSPARWSAARSRSRSSASPPAPGRAARAARPGWPRTARRCPAG